MASADNSSNSNKYVIDIEAGAETARLIEQDKLLTRAQGGFFPEEPDLSDVTYILDLGCGPGGWVLEVAFAHPDIEVVGVDINPTMIAYARDMARSGNHANAHFKVVDIKEPLAFPDASFDIVNARLISSFMDQVSWPRLLAECWRVLRPDGLIRLTEHETGISNSLSWRRFQGYCYQAMAQQKRTYSVDGQTLGVVHMFKKLLHDAGFERVTQRPYLVDGSYGSELYATSYKNVEVAFVLLKPYLLASGLIEEDAYDALYQQMLLDMLDEDFTATSFGITTCASKSR